MGNKGARGVHGGARGTPTPQPGSMARRSTPARGRAASWARRGPSSPHPPPRAHARVGCRTAPQRQPERASRFSASTTSDRSRAVCARRQRLRGLGPDYRLDPRGRRSAVRVQASSQKRWPKCTRASSRSIRFSTATGAPAAWCSTYCSSGSATPRDHLQGRAPALPGRARRPRRLRPAWRAVRARHPRQPPQVRRSRDRRPIASGPIARAGLRADLRQRACARGAGCRLPRPPTAPGAARASGSTNTSRGATNADRATRSWRSAPARHRPGARPRRSSGNRSDVAAAPAARPCSSPRGAPRSARAWSRRSSRPSPTRRSATRGTRGARGGCGASARPPRRDEGIRAAASPSRAGARRRRRRTGGSGAGDLRVKARARGPAVPQRPVRVLVASNCSTPSTCTPFGSRTVLSVSLTISSCPPGRNTRGRSPGRCAAGSRGRCGAGPRSSKRSRGCPRPAGSSPSEPRMRSK